MKTLFWIVIVMVIGFVCFKPKQPKDYPPAKVIKQEKSISYKETRLQHIVDKLTYEIKKDSIEIEHIKSN